MKILYGIKIGNNIVSHKFLLSILRKDNKNQWIVIWIIIIEEDITYLNDSNFSINLEFIYMNNK